MPTEIGGVNCLELVRDFGEGISTQGGPRATKSYLCDWPYRYQLANAMIGVSTVTGGTSGLVSLPVSYRYPESPNLLTQDVSIRGVGEVSHGAYGLQFEKAVVSASFGVPAFNVELPSDTINEIDPTTPFVWASQTLDFSAQSVTVGKNKLQYYTGSTYKTLEQTHAIPVRLVVMNLTLHRVPFLIPHAVRKNLGNLNNDVFLGCAAGKLLLDGIQVGRQFQSDGSIVQETTWKMMYRDVAPWDYILDPSGDTNNWYKVVPKDHSNLIPRFDMNILIPNGYTR